MAVVIPLFPDRADMISMQGRSCFNCEHARFPETGVGIITWCSTFEQSVDSEVYEAEDCSAYARCDEGSQPEMSGEDVP